MQRKRVTRQVTALVTALVIASGCLRLPQAALFILGYPGKWALSSSLTCWSSTCSCCQCWGLSGWMVRLSTRMSGSCMSGVVGSQAQHQDVRQLYVRCGRWSGFVWFPKVLWHHRLSWEAGHSKACICRFMWGPRIAETATLRTKSRNLEKLGGGVFHRIRTIEMAFVEPK